MAKLKYSHISSETRLKILAFLNQAQTAGDIAGIEPQEGPVFDDKTIGYGDQIRDYDIGIRVAKRILDLRKSLPNNLFTSIEQLDVVKGFGQDKLDDMAFSFRDEKEFCIRLKSWPEEPALIQNQFQLKEPFPVSILFDESALRTNIHTEKESPIFIRNLTQLISDGMIGICAKTFENICLDSQYRVQVDILGTKLFSLNLGGGTNLDSKPVASIKQG